jgi:glycosyltransferase involved in cell wall biosynthesis
MKRDNTAFMWKTKKQIFENCNLELIVASKFMLELAKASPILSRFQHHLVPFGIDLDKYRPKNIEEKRKALGIYPGNTVIFLRASASPFKGVPFIKDAINKLTTDKPLTILTVDSKELFADYLGKHQLIDLGWVNDESKIIDAYHCADIFLMPSTAEAFGVMAIEAMACGKPSIVFDGTSLPEVTFAPEAAISVPMNDSAALAEAMDRLIEDPAMRKEMGERARELADKHYSWDTHTQRVLNVYTDVLSRSKSGKQQAQSAHPSA